MEMALLNSDQIFNLALNKHSQLEVVFKSVKYAKKNR